MWQPFAGALVVAIACRGLDVVLPKVTRMKNDVHVVFFTQLFTGANRGRVFVFLPGVYVSAETNDRSLDDVAARHGGDGRSTQHFWSQVGQDERLLDRFEKS
jgi:hypothetical protein